MRTTKRELMASTAEPKLPQRDQAERSGKQSAQHPVDPRASQHPVDPRVAARERGAFDGSEHAPRDGHGGARYPHLPRGPPPFGAYCIRQFCRAHSISESFFYQLRPKTAGRR